MSLVSGTLRGSQWKAHSNPYQSYSTELTPSHYPSQIVANRKMPKVGSILNNDIPTLWHAGSHVGYIGILALRRGDQG